jgi:hypothetical protein
VPRRNVLQQNLVHISTQGGCSAQKPSNLAEKAAPKTPETAPALHLPAAAFGSKKKDAHTLPSAAHVRAARIELDMPF